MSALAWFFLALFVAAMIGWGLTLVAWFIAFRSRR